jgi:hypothetical protein
MKLFKRVDKVLAKHDAIEAVIRSCERVRTAQGRTSHLKHPVLGVLCGWTARAWLKAEPALPLCRMCEVAAQAEAERRAAS